MTDDSKKILLIGPLPPPYVGPPTAFKLFCDTLAQYPNIETDVVDISAKHLKKKTIWLSPLTWVHALRVIYQFFPAILKNPDYVIIFGSYGFLLSMGPLVVGAAKLMGKACFIRPFAGNLDIYYKSLKYPFQIVLRMVLQNADGVLVQTNLLYDYFKPLLGNRVYCFPNYRYTTSTHVPIQSDFTRINNKLKLIYVGSIREDKGVFVLLKSLRTMIGDCPEMQVCCDFFGPIHQGDAIQFQRCLAKTDNARYRGVLRPENVVATMQEFDVLVLPTYHPGEGHPGVIIEAMAAGIPVITTKFRSIPDLVQNRENGLLIQPGDPASLVQAIETIYDNRALLEKMGKANFTKRTQYDIGYLAKKFFYIVGEP